MWTVTMPPLNSEYGDAYIDAHTGEPISVTDFLAHAPVSFHLYPTKQTILYGIETLTDPQNLGASPNGWRAKSTTISGNNVASFHGQQVLSQTSGTLNFNAEYDHSLNPNHRNNIAATTFMTSPTATHSTTLARDKQRELHHSSPPHGQPGICRTFIWTLANPNRGGTMENIIIIIIHEFTHGISNRTTGGGTG
ncbi:hypothetical protein MD484_g7284, partial [Candolleomyces efflorescens]